MSKGSMCFYQGNGFESIDANQQSQGFEMILTNLAKLKFGIKFNDKYHEPTKTSIYISKCLCAKVIFTSAYSELEPMPNRCGKSLCEILKRENNKEALEPSVGW